MLSKQPYQDNIDLIWTVATVNMVFGISALVAQTPFRYIGIMIAVSFVLTMSAIHANNYFIQTEPENSIFTK